MSFFDNIEDKSVTVTDFLEENKEATKEILPEHKDILIGLDNITQAIEKIYPSVTFGLIAQIDDTKHKFLAANGCLVCMYESLGNFIKLHNIKHDKENTEETKNIDEELVKKLLSLDDTPTEE